ncbi:hypothetical protein [Salinicoccus roseus]|uniref:hypothetical protein n=1 Tax=Salinicoccus roseus TaxID=45670 RepID=UPI003DA0740E
MTFQEALEIIYADAGKYDEALVQEALGALSFWKENTHELEDDEIEELFKVMRYINTNKMGELK